MKRIPFIPIVHADTPPLRAIGIGLSAGVMLFGQSALVFGPWWRWLAERL